MADKERVERVRLLHGFAPLNYPLLPRIRFSAARRKVISTKEAERLSIAELRQWIETPSPSPDSWGVRLPDVTLPDAARLLELVKQQIS